MTRFTTTTFAIISLASMMVAQTTQPAPKAVQPRSFDSPDQAVEALLDAVSKDDMSEMTAILGSNAHAVLTSGNDAQDRTDRQQFSKLAASKKHIERSSIASGTAVLLVGDQDWPFPIPLVRTGRQWHFDAELGAVEMAARRIGANELDAIEICLGYVRAQQTYSAAQLSGKGPPAYAQKIMSSPGGKDGLYQSGEPQPLVPEGFAMASATDRNASPITDTISEFSRSKGRTRPAERISTSPEAR